MPKLKVAVISSYNEACANASFTFSLEQALKVPFDVTIFDLKTLALLQMRGEENVKRSDEHIDWICSQLENFDIVNIHSELGLYGHSVEQIKRRMLALCSHSKNLLMTVHALNISGDDFTETHTAIFDAMRARSPKDPYHLIVHIKRDKDTLINFFHLPERKITDFPVLFLNEKERKHYIETADPQAWKQKNGFASEDIIIGRFGFINSYKEYISGIKALAMLPPQYKMAFVGGQHPHTIEKFKMDKTIKEIVDFIEEYDEKLKTKHYYVDGKTPLLANRIRFFGYVSDDELYQAVANIDIALVAYFEAGQSASAATSLALELQRPCLLTYNFTFMEYDKYFPNCFEYFNIGNQYEIKDKILNFDFSKVERLKEYANRYTLDNLASKYIDIYNLMLHQAQNDLAFCDISPVTTSRVNLHSAAPSKNQTLISVLRFLYRTSRAVARVLFKEVPILGRICRPLIRVSKRIFVAAMGERFALRIK